MSCWFSASVEGFWLWTSGVECKLTGGGGGMSMELGIYYIVNIVYELYSLIPY